MWKGSGVSRYFALIQYRYKQHERARVKTDVAEQPLQVDAAWLRAVLPGARARDAHKGDFGHVLVIGGQPGMSGAARLAGEAAARVGAGLVSIATHPQHAAVLNNGRPELMCHAVANAETLKPVLERASVLAVGPGLGQSDWARGLLATVWDTDVPMIVDADALNLLAQEPMRRDRWVLTPHPGEAARLLGCSTAEVQADRLAAVRHIQARYGGVAVLKGAGSLIADGSHCRVCSAGNPGMASGGMGDVLTGVIAGLYAQGLSLTESAAAGVLLHALAADSAAQRDGERGLLASDLLPELRRWVNAG
ncbi:MAG: NAD(P)H-hydrate dehydratase [Gammaproteobacteria bacterium]|nr:NAD(P)H-hydrate dehydratase [Gammaproteobacteria bacterium]